MTANERPDPGLTLSVLKTISVSSSIPLARSASVMLPMPSSMQLSMPAKVRRFWSAMVALYGSTYC